MVWEPKCVSCVEGFDPLKY